MNQQRLFAVPVVTWRCGDWSDPAVAKSKGVKKGRPAGFAGRQEPVNCAAR